MGGIFLLTLGLAGLMGFLARLYLVLPEEVFLFGWVGSCAVSWFGGEFVEVAEVDPEVRRRRFD